MATEPAEDRPEQDAHPLAAGLSVADTEHFLAALAGQALADEAELTAAGYRFLTVEHGDPEDDDQMTRVSALSDAGWKTSRVRTIQAGNDYLTIHVDPPRAPGQPTADEVVNQLEQVADQLNPGWWRIRRSAR
jgi:hypothetical protein